MGISFENLKPPTWEGVTPDRVEREACVLGPDCVIDPPVVLAPMASVTNPPYRRLCREMGAGMVVTEMIFARGLAERNEKSLEMLDIRPNEHPVSVQLYGREPDELAEAARIVEEAGADAVDLNMGCPMRKVVNSGHGAALLREPDVVEEIFEAMTDAVSIPVTGKIRAGWEDSSAVEVARAIQNGGGAAVTIHGRTRCDMYDGHADLAVIRELKEAVEIAVIGNGDVADWVTARRMFSITGCDAVMVARGCLGNPWAFAEIAADLRGEPVPDAPSAAERGRVLRRHADLYIETYGEHRTTLEIRKHLLWYFRDTPAESVLRKRLRGIDSNAAIDEAIDAAVRACENLPVKAAS
jgi:tRNA-dihydrouridine synthase B